MGYDDVAAGDVLDLYAGPPEPLVPPEQAPEGSAAPEPAVAALAVVNAPPAAAKVVGTPSPEPTAAIALESSVEPGFNEPVGRTYIAKTGDTLSGVSLQMYGTCSKYLEIYRANREVLRDPDDLPVGTKLTIPPVEAAKAVAPH